MLAQKQAALDRDQEGVAMKKRLSKRAQKNLDKALADKNISEIEKQIMVDEAMTK